MASDNEASCASDPNFAVICSFLECFGKSCGIVYPDIARLQEMLENTQEVPQQLVDLHIKLLRKTRKTVSPEKWERALVKFCHSYSNQDGWELERFGYKKARIAVKLRLLKVLLETQFDLNQKFKNEVNKLAANELRVEPLGRDKSGLAYWCQLDDECNIRVYREDLDEENWELVAKDRDGVVDLINTLTNGEVGAIPINEDSNSLEISEKPIIDTGQITTSPSLEDEVVQENGIHTEDLCDKELDKHGGEDFEDEQEQEQDDFNEDDNIEDDMEGDDDVSNDESSKQNTEEDDSQETIQNEESESNSMKALPLMSASSKTLNGKVDALSENETFTSSKKKTDTVPETSVSAIVSDPKSIETPKSKEHTEVNNVKINSEESVPLKSIETSVITSPLKLVNVSELKQIHEEKVVTGITALNITKKHEESMDQTLKPLDKLPSKNNFSFPSAELQPVHKLSVKPIDQLAANLVRIQSEKLEKPMGTKSLEKIAKNLARSGSIVGNSTNEDDDRLPQDFCARNQMEKANALKEHRGMDLSTSPRGWESTNEQKKPMDFSGIDLSSRKFNKPIDILSSGYRTQDFQHREMDLSTKKLNKPEVTNLPYDARAVMMRNHAMVADLSKRQLSFPSYDMSSAPYHNAARIPNKEDHRLPNYTILPDPSKMTALRMNTTPVKRTLEGDDLQYDMLKRIRADVIPIRGSIDKRPMMSTNWRDEIGEAIEEPVMMIQGEGSGSDCDAVNPGLGEAVEEPIIFFYGEGSGEECQTGNPGDSTSADNKESNESKNEVDSATSSLSTNKSFSEGSLINEVSAESLVKSKGSVQEKPKFKPTLGIQIIPKNSSSSVKRLSRWDVGKPEEKPECDSSIISNKEDISQKRNKIECEDSSSKNQDIKIDGNTINTEDVTSQQSNLKSENLQEDVGESSTKQKQSPVDHDSVQCDSSISSCQADTSETFESCTETTTHSLNDKPIVQNVCDTDSTTLQETVTSEKVDNECKPLTSSPPRFFFGPNCISYTSKSEMFESQSDHTVSTSIESKSDTLQYECVSSSKSAEDMVTSYRTEDFDVTQTNNNSLKVNLYTRKATNPLCEDDNKNKLEEIEGATNSWEPTVSSKYSLEQSCESLETETNVITSESKADIDENLTSCTADVQDSISSTETATKEYTKSEETEALDTISQPHSTNDLIKRDADMKLESAVITPSEIQVNLPIESTPCTTLKQECSTFEEQNKESESDTIKHTNISVPCSEAEAYCKSPEVSSFKESEMEVDSVSPKSSCSSSGTQNLQKNNFTESDHASETECSVDQEANNSVGEEIEYVSQKVPFDPSITSCKENNESDVDPVCQNQKEPLIESDNKNTKNLVGADAESLHVNCNENSEEVNIQNEVSEDSEIRKEKISTDPFIKNSVPDVNTKLDSIDNSTVSSSESVEKCNKDTLVPTISSSDDSCIRQDVLSHDSVELSFEKSSVKDDCPTYDILPETVPDTNISNSSKSNIVDSTKESNAVQTAILVEQSSCTDQDLNKDVIIDYKSLKDNQPSKSYEEKACLNETSSNENDASKLQSQSAETISCEKEKTEAVNFVDSQQETNVTIEPTTSENYTPGQDKEDNTSQHEDTTKCIQDKNEENQKQTIVSSDLESNSKVESNDTESEIEQEKCTETKPVDSQEHKIKPCLVANYESSDSNDSNDAFETLESAENRSNFSSNSEETMTDTEQNEKKNEERLSTKNKVLSNEVQDVPTEKQTESTLHSIESIMEKTEQKQEKITNEEIPKEEHDFVQHDFSEKISVDKEEHVDSEENNVKLAEKEALVSSEINPMNKEFINLGLNKANNLVNIVKEGEKESADKVSEKVVDIVPVEKSDCKIDSMNEIVISKQTKDGVKLDNEVIPEDLKAEPSKSIQEKLLSLDNDVKFVKNEEVRHVTEELLITETSNKPKKSFEHGDREKKFDTNLQEEKSLNKEESNMFMHLVSSNLPLKSDSITVNVEKTEIHKNNISIASENFKPVDSLQFVNCISEKSENITDNHENHKEPLHITNKAIESLSENTVSSKSDSSANSGQEATLEPVNVTNDCKKEASKRVSDVSDTQDVPPLKSKPPCIESNEQILEDLANSKVQSDKNLDNVKQTEVANETETKDNPISNSTAPTKDEGHAVANVLNNILTQVERKNTEINEKKASSEIQSVEIKTVSLISDDSMDADNNLFGLASEEMDPLACTDDEGSKKADNNEQINTTPPKISLRVKPVSELIYGGWKLDSTEPSSKISRKRRNSTHESNPDDTAVKPNEESMGGKRMRLRARRMVDKQLRKSIEESRVVTISSDDEAVKSPKKQKPKEVKDASDDQAATNLTTTDRKGRGRPPRGRRRRGVKGNNRSNRAKNPEFQGNQVSDVSPEIQIDETPEVQIEESSEVQVDETPEVRVDETHEGQTDETPEVQIEETPEVQIDESQTNTDPLNMTPVSQKKRKKRKMVLGLEVGRDIEPEPESGVIQDETPVRQSRRIAQLKIKEAQLKLEEVPLSERKDGKEKKEKKEKKDSVEKKKRKKQKPESEEESVVKEIEKEKKSKKKRRKRKKKNMLTKFNESNPWQSSSGSSSDEENENEEEEEEEEDIESEGSLLFKSDHEFSPESDLEKDQEAEPLRRARTAQKAQSDVEEADDEYACQKCGKADHPEWILLCDSCDKGWHCSCLRPALMLIPEGDWFCPPCQHNLLVVKLRENLKTYDQLTKRHENEVLRKKRLAFVGISLDNVLHKNEPRHQKESKTSSQESDNESTTSSSTSSTETSSSEESEPVYQLRERRCANRYKFNDYDAMINAAIQDEVEAVQGAGNQGRGKDIATIVNAKKEEAELEFKNEILNMDEMPANKEDIERKSEKDSDEEFKIDAEDGLDEEEEEQHQESQQHKGAVKKFLSRKKHRKLNSLDISSEDDPESDEDFKGTSSEEEEDFDDHMTSSDDSSFADVRRRNRRGDSRSVRRSTRVRTTRFDEDFINDDSEESDRPKRKKSRSIWDSENEDSDNSWRQRRKKSRTISTSRYKSSSKTKSRKKKKRKRIIESDNQSDNEESNDEQKIETPSEVQPEVENNESETVDTLNVKLDNETENNENKDVNEIKDDKLQEIKADVADMSTDLSLQEPLPQKKKKEKVKKTPIRRKIIYGGLPDENKPEEEETLGRRTRGRKMNYQEEIASDSEEELKKALRRTGESEDEFVMNDGEDVIEDAEKDSDSGDIYNPKKDGHKVKNKSPKSRKPRKSKSPGVKRKMMSDGTPKQRKKPGPKPGSKSNRSRKQNFLMGSLIQRKDDQDDDKDIMANIDNPMGEIDSKIDDNLSENVGLTGTAMSVAGSFTGDVPEGSLTGLGPGELADLDDEQLEQMMMEDEEYGRRQLELAAIEIAKKKKKEEREAKKMEKARLKALEILAAERQRDPNAPEGTDGEVPKKKKRGRRSKAEILAEQMRRDGAPDLNATGLPSTVPHTNISPNLSINPTIMTPDADRPSEGPIPVMTGPDGQLFNPDGSPLKPKRRGRGKGKKTLALEAARAAEAAAKAAVEVGLLSMGTDSNPEIKPGEIPNILPTPGSSTSGSAPSTPPAGVVTTQGPPASQTPTTQPVYPSLPPNQQSSVITRMLQSQPVSSSPQSFSAAAAAMGHKYFGGPNAGGGQIIGGPRTGYEMQPRGRIPSPYRQAGQSSMPPHFAAVRSGTPPMRMRVPGPQIYHTPHHPMDPSPSGGGPISINNRDRSSPLGPGPAMIPPAAGSPLAKGGPTPPPPPPYVRGAPPLSRFTDNPMGPRHQMPPFTNASPVNHNLQQPSPPPNRPPGNFSPYHPPPPPNYHYGAYPPPPPLSTADDAAAYQGSPYPADHFSSPADNQPPIQAPPPPQPPPQQQAHPNDAAAGNKQYDEEGSGEFGGLVSYFSSQREDDLDS
ncbi:uncharacterized protein LOC100874631 isoform X3 [Megachile rotundata]|uniref:uncharacterized protein LOC100874631 isoform X3 n=1 Tax=Megachile rotundata TaxID=143995 RepID=UPI003FD6927B